MEKLIKKIIREFGIGFNEPQLLDEQSSGQGAQVCGVICDPAPGQSPIGEHCDGFYIKICNKLICNIQMFCTLTTFNYTKYFFIISI